MFHEIGSPAGPLRGADPRILAELLKLHATGLRPLPEAKPRLVRGKELRSIVARASSMEMFQRRRWLLEQRQKQRADAGIEARRRWLASQRRKIELERRRGA